MMDKSLSYKEHILLLSHIRQDLIPHAAQTIYKVMILPLLVYCNFFIDMSPHKKQQFEKIQMRYLELINDKGNSIKLPSINHIRNKMCIIEVLKCLKGVSPPDYEKYFKRLDHCKCTHGNSYSSLLPQAKSQAGRNTFAFLGAKIFNKLPKTMKAESSIVKSKTACKDFNFDL